MTSDLTSVHLRRARDGDDQSLGWIVSRLSPFLRVQASYRLPAGLARLYDPEDLVNEVWAVALPRLSEIGDPERRCTPALLKFLSSTLLNKINGLIVRHIRERSGVADSGASLGHLSAHVTSVLRASERDEARVELQRALATLDARDREVVVLRGIEQISNQDAALLLAESENTVAMRYGRALTKLRERLPGSMLDELPD